MPFSRGHLMNYCIEAIARPSRATIDMCWAVILSSASAERRIPNIIHGRCRFGRDCFTLPLAGLLLLTCCGASVPRYDSAFHLAMFEVRAKHFRQYAANSKNLTLCNQKHRLFFYCLGKCFAPTSLGRITREPDAVKGNRLSSRNRAGGIVRNDNP